MSNSSIWYIDRTQTDSTTPGQSGPGSGGNNKVLRIPWSSSITGASPADCLVSYLGHLYVCVCVCGGVLPLCRDAFGVFNSLNWLDSWQANEHMEIWFLWKNKKGILQNRCRVSTTVWLYDLEVKRTIGEKEDEYDMYNNNSLGKTR